MLSEETKNVKRYVFVIFISLVRQRCRSIDLAIYRWFKPMPVIQLLSVIMPCFTMGLHGRKLVCDYCLIFSIMIHFFIKIAYLFNC